MESEQQRVAADRRWFRQKQLESRYGYGLVTTTNIRPEDLHPAVYGHHRSIVIAPGVRFWAFRSKTGRDLVGRNYNSDVIQSQTVQHLGIRELMR